jgi:hypothetical protein
MFEVFVSSIYCYGIKFEEENAEAYNLKMLKEKSLVEIEGCIMYIEYAIDTLENQRIQGNV